MSPQHLHRLTSPAGSTTPPLFDRPSSRADSLEDVATFEVPVGYRLAMTGAPATVECACGCGWSVAVGTLSGMPATVREHLFQYHQDWHTKQRAHTQRP
jgi:hypothetical protein